MVIRVRCLLFAALALMLVYASFLSTHESLQRGVALVPLRRVQPILVSLAEHPIAYWLIVLFVIGLGLLSAGVAVRLLWAVVSPASVKSSRLMESVLSRAEESAPSGLTPMWVGLAIVAVCVLLYAAFL